MKRFPPSVSRWTTARSDTIDTYGRWEVSPLRSYEQGLALRGVDLATPTHPLAVDPPRALLFEFLAAATCHATNWDQLRRHLLDLAIDGSTFTPELLATMDLPEFRQVVGPAYGDAEDIPRRHTLFVEVANALAVPSSRLFVNSLVGGLHRLGGADGLYGRLDGLQAFHADPQRKKTRILVQHLLRYGLLSVVDPEEVLPAVEYHLIRMYLRTGRVIDKRSTDDARDPARAADIRSLTHLRNAVEQAMHYTARGAELPLADVNEIEWQIARSYCERSAPRCEGPPRADKRPDISITALAGGACPFVATCRGSAYEDLLEVAEPRLATRHAFY